MTERPAPDRGPLPSAAGRGGVLEGLVAKDRIPVVIVAGFLGSGKTTLLNHLLRHNKGTRIGVVVNDFGRINIDAMSVAGQVDSMVTLGNGCLCCSVDPSGVDALLERLARPAAGIDVIVIEASGLAEPQGMIRLVLASTHERIEYGGLVQLVDAAEFERTRREHPELERHLALADLVVLNKTDRLAEEDRPLLVKTVEELSTGKPVLATEHGRVDADLLFDHTRPTAPEREARQLSFDQLLAEDDDHEQHAHARYDCVEFTSDRPLNPRRFMAFLEDRPSGLYRTKGFVYFGLPGYRDKFALHTVGGFVRFEILRWAAREPRQSQLVFIGTGIDSTALLDRLHSCVEADPDNADPQAIYPVLRYLPDDEQPGE
jgi:G3E family GTPase